MAFKWEVYGVCVADNKLHSLSTNYMPGTVLCVYETCSRHLTIFPGRMDLGFVCVPGTPQLKP